MKSKLESSNKLLIEKRTSVFNTKFLLLSILLLSAHVYALQNPGNNPTFTNNPTITANPTFNTPINATINPQFITNTTSTINAIGVQMKDVALTVMQKMQDTFTKENYRTAKDVLKTLLWQYRYTIAAGTIATVYSSTNLLLLHDYYYLKDTQRWSHWKSDCTFELLCAIPHTELTQELIRSIGEYHYNKRNPNDASHPLITFIATIEKEIKICKRYLQLAKTIQQLHLTKIFPGNAAKIDDVNRFLERCLFVKHLFLSWLTERNLINRTRRTTPSKPHKIAIRWPYYHQNMPLLPILTICHNLL